VSGAGDIQVALSLDVACRQLAVPNEAKWAASWWFVAELTRAFRGRGKASE
jgi:hypothetical protein